MADPVLPQGSPSVGFSEVRLIEDATPDADPSFVRLPEVLVAGHARRRRPPDATRGTGRRGDVGRRTALTVATVLILILTMVLANVAEVRETHARSAALAEATHVLAPVGGPVAVRWSADAALWPGAIVAAGLLVGVETAGAGVFGAVAIDPGSGSVVWRALQNEAGGRSAVQSCHLLTSPAAEGLAGAPDAPDFAIMCLITRRAGARLDNRQPTYAVLLDARTGEVREGAVPFEPAVHEEVPAPGVDDGSLRGMTVELTPAGGLVALDSRSRSTRWTLRPEPFRTPPAVLRTRVLARGPERLVCVDGGSGRVMWSHPVRPDAAGLLTDGEVVLVPQDDPARGTVLTAVDVDHGYVEWTSDIPEDLHLFVLDGRLYGASRDRLVGLG